MGNKSAGAIYLQKNQSAEEDDPPDQEAAVGDPELEPERCVGLDRLAEIAIKSGSLGSGKRERSPSAA